MAHFVAMKVSWDTVVAEIELHVLFVCLLLFIILVNRLCAVMFEVNVML